MLDSGPPLKPPPLLQPNSRPQKANRPQPRQAGPGGRHTVGGAAGAVAVFIGNLKSFQGALCHSHNSPVFLCAFTRTVLGPRLSTDALETSEDCTEDDIKHISVSPRKSNSIRIRRTAWTPSLLTITLHSVPSAGSRACGGSVLVPSRNSRSSNIRELFSVAFSRHSAESATAFATRPPSEFQAERTSRLRLLHAKFCACLSHIRQPAATSLRS